MDQTIDHCFIQLVCRVFVRSFHALALSEECIFILFQECNIRSDISVPGELSMIILRRIDWFFKMMNGNVEIVVESIKLPCMKVERSALIVLQSVFVFQMISFDQLSSGKRTNFTIQDFLGSRSRKKKKKYPIACILIVMESIMQTYTWFCKLNEWIEKSSWCRRVWYNRVEMWVVFSHREIKMDFWQVHGWVFILCLFFFPRLTLFFSSVASGGILWWTGFVFAPRLLVAILATTAYWNTNTILVVFTWFWALSGESTEKFVVSKRFR